MDLREQIEGMSFLNKREISIQYAMDSGKMRVLSRLKDEYHDMKLYWLIDVATHCVEEMDGLMDEQPFDDCGNALRILKQMPGLEIGVGVKRNFRARFAKQEGCTHITELAVATFDFIISRLYGPASGEYTEEEKGKRRCQIAHFLCKNNSCSIFNEENISNFDERGRYKKKDYNY